jgi:hypothetical protein
MFRASNYRSGGYRGGRIDWWGLPGGGGLRVQVHDPNDNLDTAGIPNQRQIFFTLKDHPPQSSDELFRGLSCGSAPQCHVMRITRPNPSDIHLPGLVRLEASGWVRVILSLPSERPGSL